MTFLAPAGLLGIALLALPIIVHLFKPRKMRQTPFSSLRWLRQTQQRLSRRVQWHQWLLFLLRAGFITCLVLALARPLVSLGGRSRPADRLVIVDAGRSMAYQDGTLQTPLQRAQELAQQYVLRARPGDRTAIVVAGAQAQVIAPLVADATPHSAELGAVRADGAEADLGRTLSVVGAMLPGAEEERDVEVVLLTGNRQEAWRQGPVQAFVKKLGQRAQIRVVDVGPVAPHNAWIAGAKLIESNRSQDRVLRVEVASVGAGKEERTVRLTGVEGLSDEAQPVALKGGQLARVDFRIAAGVPLAGQVAEVRLEPADALASDDSYFVNLDTPWALRVLLVEPDGAGGDVRGPGLHFRAGIMALTAGRNRAIEVIDRTTASVSAGDIQNADVVVLAGVPELPEAALQGLEARVRGGAGLALFLGPNLQASFYNQKLYRPLPPGEGLLPVALQFAPGLTVRQVEAGLLTKVRWSHPLLAGLHDPTVGDLAQCRFPYRAALASDAGKDDLVLARFEDETPAIVEHPVGAGRVLFFNMTANDDWGDLPRRSGYVPLLDRMVSYLAAGSVERRFSAGAPLLLPLPDWDVDSEIKATSPSGELLRPEVSRLRGQPVVRLDGLHEPGVYRLFSTGPGGRTLNVAVNASRAGSGLTPMDSKVLQEWWAPTALEILGADTATQMWQPTAASWPLWPALLCLAALLLWAEMVYAYWLCPRVNPAIAGSVVHRRGILRPMTEDLSTASMEKTS